MRRRRATAPRPTAALRPTASELRLRRVESAEAAREACFLGSPSVRIDGVDVEPAARTRTDFGLQCRVYPCAQGGLEGAPSVDMIRAALEASSVNGGRPGVNGAS